MAKTILARRTQPLRTIFPPAFAASPQWNPNSCANFVDLPVSRKCNNHCGFCYSNSGKDEPFFDLKTLTQQLVSERRRGIRRVHFVGGEPTLHPQISSILKIARRLGFENVMVTNGARFSSPDFCDETFPFIDEIIFSLHGHDAKTHGEMTQNPHSFHLMTAAFQNASEIVSKKGRPRLCVNTVVTNRNLHSLLPIARLIHPFGIKRYLCLIVVPLGRGKETFLDLSPRLQDCAAVFPQVIEESWKLGIQFLVSGLPLCALGPRYPCSLDISGEYVTNRTRSGDVVFEKQPGASSDFKIDWNRMKVSKCRNCAVEKFCCGVYGQYYHKYGDVELIPFQRSERRPK